MARLPKGRTPSTRLYSLTSSTGPGLHAKVIQERLGHSRISQTLDTCAHVIPELHEEAASVLENALSVERELTRTAKP